MTSSLDEIIRDGIPGEILYVELDNWIATFVCHYKQISVSVFDIMTSFVLICLVCFCFKQTNIMTSFCFNLFGMFLFQTNKYND